MADNNHFPGVNTKMNFITQVQIGNYRQLESKSLATLGYYFSGRNSIYPATEHITV